MAELPKLPKLSLRALRGAPVVLARADGWRSEVQAPDTVEAIRTELRGLGAALLVRTGDAAWCVRADDEPVFLDAGADLAALDQETGGAALVVLDGEGQVRFCRTLVPASSLAGTLLGALRSARAAVVAQRPAVLAMSRRDWLTASLVASFAAAFLDACAAHDRPAPGVAAPQGPTTRQGTEAGGLVDVVLHVNGQDRPLRLDPRTSLLDALRGPLGLTGTKEGCAHGQCGACTVLLGGRRVNSCLVLAVAAQGERVTTIEGLAEGDRLHPVQAAFVAEDAFQCGFCTPGQILSAVALLAEGQATTDDELREAMSGNLCRCGAYPNIVRAVQRVRRGGGA